MDMKKECWNCKNNNQYAKFPCDYCHTGNIDDFWKPKDEMKDFAIEEIEKIKKKIKNDCILHEEWFVNIDDLEKCLCRIDAIVDKEISELKGDKDEI